MARQLGDYTNQDGTAPEGEDNDRDDTVALRKALDAGPGIVYVGPGHYRWGNVTVPSGVSVVGARGATVVRSSGPKCIFVQKGPEWTIRDLVLDGETAGDWRKRKDDGRSGIFAARCRHFEIVGVTVRNFNGAGIQLTHTAVGTFFDAGKLERITATGNYVGIRFDERAEYITAAQLSCNHNVAGCVIHAGNISIHNSNFSDNTDGLVIEDKDNGSHGTISGCLMNHNARYALLARDIRNGMTINGCCFFYGSIRLENSVGVQISSGLISCPIEAIGAGSNRIAENYIIPRKWQFRFSPSTIVIDNFTENGSWDKNRVPQGK